MVHGFNRVFCRFIFVPAYNGFHVTVSPYMSNYFVSYVLARIIHFVRCRFSRLLLRCFYVCCLFRLVQCLFMTMSSTGIWRVRYAVNGDIFWNTVLVNGYSISFQLQDAIRSGCFLLKCVVRLARQRVCR